MRRQVLVLELNELNFDAVDAYHSSGRLSYFRKLIDRHGLIRTGSEQRYELLEPWIQWVTAHTGMPYEQHRVFHLGDMAHADFEQVWERLERQGVRVGAVSPMNARCRVSAPSFFVPDPWTQTDVVGPEPLRRLHGAIREMVNENATSGASKSAVARVLEGALRYSAVRNWPRYCDLALRGARRPWTRAMFLDLLLADVFVSQVRRARPDFATLFLNAAAHIQHHYLFNSPAYREAGRNPAWYVPPDVDPVLEVYELHERIVRQVVRTFPTARVMLATGLHQEPHGGATFYWRLRDHADFLRAIGAEFTEVAPRMSRDFEVSCADAAQALATARRLRSCAAEDGTPIFEVTERGTRLFVMLTYPHEVTADAIVSHEAGRLERFGSHVAFVAIKNGRHNGTGYLLDTGVRAAEAPTSMPLSDLFGRMISAVGIGAAS